MCKILIVKADGGYFKAEPSQDPEYPGIDIEFIADNKDENNVSRPRILFEKPIDGYLRALAWSSSINEDYEEEIVFA